MKVLVVGAHGHTGQLLIKELKAAEHEVYAMVREYNQAGRMKQLGAEQIITADLKNNVSRSPKGMDAVLFAAGAGFNAEPAEILAVDQVGAKKLIDASRVQGVRHFVMLSCMGADDPAGSDTYYLEAKGAADAHLQSSGLTYTIIRTGPFTIDQGAGRIEAKEKINDRINRSISREDTAAVMAASLTEKNVQNKTFELLSGKDQINRALQKL